MAIRYLVPFLSAFFFNVCLLASLLTLPAFLDRRNGKRHLNRKNCSRLGGAGLVISFLAALLFNQSLVITPSISVMMAGLGAFLFFGIIDDIRELDWKWQLSMQVTLVTLVVFFGIRLSYVTVPFLGMISLEKGFFAGFGFLLSIIWIVSLVNAMNWVDGLDGISGLISLVAAGVIFIISLRPEVNQPPVSIIAAAFFGSILAFLVFNFHPARIMAGTGGVYFMGFVLGFLAIFAGAKVATTLLVLAIPIIDFFWVIIQRLKNGSSVFLADRRHLHFKLFALGWSQKKISLFYFVITLIIAAVALQTRMHQKFFSILAAFVFVSLIIFWADRKRDEMDAQ